MTANQTCEYREIDSKRRPVSHDYLAALEDRVAWFESFICKLKTVSDDERNGMLENINFRDHFTGSTSGESCNGAISQLVGLNSAISLQASAEGIY